MNNKSTTMKYTELVKGNYYYFKGNLEHIFICDESATTKYSCNIFGNSHFTQQAGFLIKDQTLIIVQLLLLR